MLGKWDNGKYYVEGLEYTFPPKPNNKDIINYKLPKKQQKWKRITTYENFDWSEGWEERINDPENEDQLNYLIEEVDRLYNGVWVFINGEPTYLNRYMYFFLNWFILEDSGEYPQYRDTSLYYYRFLEICINTKLCTGHTLVKARRLGATSMIMAYFLLKLITTNNKKYGITSKTGDDAAGAFNFVVNAFQNLPVFLRPQMEGNTAPKRILSLKKQAERIRKDHKANKVGSEGLNNQCYWRATNLNTFDSGAYEDILVDESGKYPAEVPISKYLPIVTKCVKKGARVSGKIHLPTTVNPPKSGGAEYRTVWDNSNQAKADYLGQTKTGLYRIFIPAYCGFDGYVDEFGNSVIENPTPEQTKYLESIGYCPDPTIGAKQYLSLVRKNLESNEEDLQEEVRMNPFTAEEVFESANNRCLFRPIENLNKRENELVQKLEERGLNPLKDELGRRGWFHKMPNNKVRFIDDDKGLWYTFKLLPEDQANRFKEVGNKIIPLNESFGAAGLDPIQSGQATVDKGSDMCCIIHSRYSHANENESDIPVAMFLGRMDDIDRMYEQVYNGLIYYGVKMLAERAPDYFAKYAKDKGLLEYLYGTIRSDGTEVKGIVAQQTSNLKEEHARVQVMKFRDCWYKIPFINLIRNMKNFSVDDRTDYDVCMAWGYALMALEYPFKKELKKEITKRMIRKGKVVTV